MNPETAREDVMKLRSGAAVVYDEPLKLNELRSDLHFYPVPFDKLVGPVCPEAKLRKLVRNMIYDGVVAWLLSIEMEEMRKALVTPVRQAQGQGRRSELGRRAGRLRFRRQDLHQDRPVPRRAHERDRRQDHHRRQLRRARLGAMFAGVTVVTWYPITPSSSLVESLIGYLKRFRHDPETGKATYAVVQAEDELASIGMALGAGWAGARSMTSTAGPGISLMSRIHRPGLLRRDPRGGFRRGARRPLHRPAHAHHAGRHPLERAALARRYAGTRCSSLLAGRVLHA